MIVKYGLPLLAAVLLGVAIFYVTSSNPAPADVPPLIQPAESPFPQTVAASGLIEPQSEDIAVGSPVSGVAVNVFVKPGQIVEPKQPLFELDDRQLRAELAVRQAALKAAQAELARVKAEPRKEQIPLVEAQVAEAKANLADKQDQHRRYEELVKKNAVSAQEVTTRRNAYHAAVAQLGRVEAELTMLQTAAWHTYDVSVSEAAVAEATAQVQLVDTEIARLQVRALERARVLKVNLRPGQFVATPSTEPLIVLGSVDQFHVRVDIDEHDIPRFVDNAEAKASIKGVPGQFFKLTQVRVEPYVVPKRSLTGLDTERVDTRVLQVIYALETGKQKFYVGQQLEVFIDAAAPSALASR